MSNMESKTAKDINSVLSRLTVGYRITSEKLMREIGLHAGQAQILSVLWKEDGLSQAEIVRELCISPPTVNSLVAKLNKSKFVTTKKCPRDKRLMRVHLTKKGKNIREKVEKQMKKLKNIVLSDFSDTEQVLVAMLLEKIRSNLQNLDPNSQS